MKKLQKQIYEYLKKRDWLQHNTPPHVAKSICIEAAELLELFQWINPTEKEFHKDKEKVEKAKKELADVLIYCLEFANLLHADAEALVLAKLAEVKKKYPPELVKGKNLKNYYKIKEAHRKARL